nr:MAG TPA: hypothetical protein [Bacteriophage sp.]
MLYLDCLGLSINYTYLWAFECYQHLKAFFHYPYVHFIMYNHFNF